MRILMLAQNYPPILGGEERAVQDLSVQLAARGHDVAVVTLWHEGLEKYELDHNVRVYRINGTIQRAPWLFRKPGRWHAPPFPDPEILAAMRRIIIRERPDIVHAHNWMIHSFLPLKAWSDAGLVLTIHDYSLACAKKRLFYNENTCAGPGFLKCLGCAADHYGKAKGTGIVLINRITSLFERTAVDMFLVVSSAVAVGNQLTERNLPFKIIPNFVPDNLAELKNTSEHYSSQLPDEDFLLFVGAFVRYKGVDVLFQAYANLTDAPPLVIIGYESSEYPVETVDLPPNVFVFKNWPHDAVMAAWSRSIIGLAPSTWAEPFGIVVLEAMANGRPVIASRIGGLTDMVVDGENGLLVSPRDSEALHQAIKYLLDNPEIRERMGQAAKRKVAEFYASSVLPRYEQAYQDVIQARKR